MVGQYFVEKHYSKGMTRHLTARQLQALADAEGKAVVIQPTPPTDPTIPGGERK